MNLKKKTFYSIKLFLAAISIYSFVFVPLASASEITITGNGSDSTSQVQTQTDSNTQITQTNSADISNEVTAEANTGNNQASDNSGGDVSIETGDSDSHISVENSGNTSIVNSNDCCAENETGLNITGNGSNSDNQINYNQDNSNNVNVYQNANISTSIVGFINTGNNRANDNSGGSNTIITGDIHAAERIINGPINFSQITISPLNEKVTATIKDNGSDSDNNINYATNNNQFINVNNYSIIDNYSFWYLNTGNNEASDNRGGDVLIETGDIDFISVIKNFINKSVIEIDCCEIELPDIDDPDDPDVEENKETKNEDKKDENKIPAGSEAKAGGPGILGLSDTSGAGLGSFLFWIGLAIAGTGSKIMYGEFEKVFKKKN